MLDGARAVVIELVRKPPSRSCVWPCSHRAPCSPIIYSCVDPWGSRPFGHNCNAYDTTLFAVPSAVPGEGCEKHDMDFAIVIQSSVPTEI